MNVKLSNVIKIAFTLCCVLLLSSSCTKNNDYYYSDTDIYNKIFTITNNSWTWNENLSRYEYSIALSDLSKDMYDNGALTASVFINEGDGEIQTPLPYVRSWINNASSLKYTETLSFEISLDRKRILYYIQESDMSRKNKNDFPDYEIKVSIVSYF